MKIREPLYILLIVVLYGISMELYFTNKDLKDDLTYTNKLIEHSNTIDSLNRDSKDSLTETIKEYYTETKYTQNGKELLDDDIIRLINERYEFESKLYQSNYLLNLIKNEYDIEYQIEQKGNELICSRKRFGKADSALLLLPAYRDKISKDGETWSVSITLFKEHP